MRTYSFDIFDTCLIRRCGDPNGVFDLMAERAFIREVSIETKRAFVAARLSAADKSWSDSQTLLDIYDSFDFEHVDLLSKDKLMELEMEIEREVLEPMWEMTKLVSVLRSAGNHIVFISDMYLGKAFLLSILQKNGLWQEGDAVYVSCDVGLTKASGRLYSFIKNEEQIPYHSWHHFGNDLSSDVKIPHKLGIHAHLISNDYTPFQRAMKKQASLYYQWGGVLAGLSRSIALHSERSAHKDFVLDIIAPLFVPFVFRVMSDAQSKGINTLYFCARDAYPLYRIAMKLQVLFPEISIEYLYISRKALYEGEDNEKIGYYKQIGLASKTARKAIVDIRSRGLTIHFLNDILNRNNFNPVFCYLLELCTDGKEQFHDDYYTELNDCYLRHMGNAFSKIISNWMLFELFFPLNVQKRTIGYEYNGREYVPILEPEDNKEFKLDNLEEYICWRNQAIDEFTDHYIRLGLYKYADDIFSWALSQLAGFILYPHKHYLQALDNFYCLCPDNVYRPYVERSIIRLPLTIVNHRTIWKRGTIFYNLPSFLLRWLYKNR